MSSRREFIQNSAVLGVLAATPLGAVESAKEKRRASAENGLLRLGIVGTGQISHRYLKQAVDHPKARFVATCARTLDSAKARAVEYGMRQWFDDYEAMYDKVKPDAVVIATPSAVHAAPAIAALKRGIHVLCEKPMATRYEDCQAMVAAAKESGAIFLALPFDATAAFRTALQYLNEDTIGVFTGAESQLNIGGHDRANWYYDRNVAGGVMLDTLVYPVSQLISLLGPAKRVTGRVNTLIPHRIVGDKTVESDIDDNVSLIVEWAGGQQAVLRALWGTSMYRGDTIVYGRRGALVTGVFSNDVTVHSPARVIQDAQRTTWNGEEGFYRVPVKPIPDIRGEGLIDHFADCIQGRAQPTCGGPQQLHVHEILFKGYEAARTGRAQELQTTFMPWHKIDPAFFDTRSRPI